MIEGGRERERERERELEERNGGRGRTRELKREREREGVGIGKREGLEGGGKKEKLMLFSFLLIQDDNCDQAIFNMVACLVRFTYPNNAVSYNVIFSSIFRKIYKNNLSMTG